MHALYHVLRQFCTRYPDPLRRAQLFVEVDNQSVVEAFRRGRAKDPETHALLAQLFDFQSGIGAPKRGQLCARSHSICVMCNG